MMKRLSRRRSGQAAVETAFSIPVLAVLFLIGFQLYALTWTAQAAHVRARYAAMARADHATCYHTGGGPGRSIPQGVNALGQDTRSLRSDRGILSGIRQDRYTMTQRAYVACYMRGP